MGITVIGSLTRDTLIFPNKNKCRITESLGGILYTVVALAALTEEKIYPVCNVGYDIYESTIAILKKFENVDLSCIRKEVIENIHCYILYASEYGTQYDKGKEVLVSFDQIKPFLSKSKFIIVSPATGFDVPLDVIQNIKQDAKCPVYLDYHILSLGRDKLGNRFLHKRDDWLEWCKSCDYLQLNKFEAELLYENSINFEKDILGFSKPILDEGVKAIAITLGSKGVSICYHNEKGNIRIEHLNVIKVDKVVDATGCGDVFVAGFISHFIKTNDILGSYNFANNIASLKVKISGTQDLFELIKQMGVQGYED